MQRRRKSASVFGRATIDGAGSFVFRIDVSDLGEPGTNDLLRDRAQRRLRLGQKQLQGGNVQIHKS